MPRRYSIRERTYNALLHLNVFMRACEGTVLPMFSVSLLAGTHEWLWLILGDTISKPLVVRPNKQVRRMRFQYAPLSNSWSRGDFQCQ